MTIAITSRDLAALPAAALPLAKTQMRVDHAGDDEFIKSVIARAIAKFEQTNEVTINPTTVKWTPAIGDFCNGSATVPVRPVSSFSVLAGTPPVQDFGYVLDLKWDSIHGVPIQVLKGTAAAGLEVTLTCGFTAIIGMPPPVEDVVLRHSAHLYEHREILLPGKDYMAPDLALDATWWMPRV